MPERRAGRLAPGRQAPGAQGSHNTDSVDRGSALLTALRVCASLSVSLQDTAGQSNMYPTVMRPFEAGGEQEDKTSKAAAEDTAKLAGGAGAAAVLVVIAGLAALTLSGGERTIMPTHTDAGPTLAQAFCL